MALSRNFLLVDSRVRSPAEPICGREFMQSCSLWGDYAPVCLHLDPTPPGCQNRLEGRSGRLGGHDRSSCSSRQANLGTLFCTKRGYFQLWCCWLARAFFYWVYYTALGAPWGGHSRSRLRLAPRQPRRTHGERRTTYLSLAVLSDTSEVSGEVDLECGDYRQIPSATLPKGSHRFRMRWVDFPCKLTNC